MAVLVQPIEVLIICGAAGGGFLVSNTPKMLKATGKALGTAFKNTVGKDLYAFWGDKITNALKKDLDQHKSKLLINLASDEYFKSVKVDKLGYPVIAPVFQDEKAGKYKIITFLDGFHGRTFGAVTATLCRRALPLGLGGSSSTVEA